MTHHPFWIAFWDEQGKGPWQMTFVTPGTADRENAIEVFMCLAEKSELPPNFSLYLLTNVNGALTEAGDRFLTGCLFWLEV